MSTVLVASRDEDTRIIVRELLKHSGYRVVTARTGDEALDAAVRARPALLIEDYCCPTHGLRSLADAVREERPAALAGIPTLALTAFTNAHDIAVIRRSEYTAVVPKPFRPTALVREVERLLEPSPS